MSEKGIDTTNDLNTPELYEKNIVGAFAVLFSPFFGALLLALNLRRLNNKTASIVVFAFGIVYTFVSIVLLQLVANNSNLAILLNVIGAGILTMFFWKRYIGKTTEFMARHWGKPALVIVGFLLVVILGLVYWYEIIEWIGVEG